MPASSARASWIALVAILAAALVAGCVFEPDATAPLEPRPDTWGDLGGSEGDAGREPAEPVCEPAEVTCRELQRAVCSSAGDGWILTPCPPGFGCVSGGECELAHPRVLFVFDTSSSMAAPLGPGGDPAADDCGTPEPESSRIAASKELFLLLFEEPLATAPRMGLMRFPQAVQADPACEAAIYLGRGTIRGDDGSHEVPSERGTWFRNGLRDVLAVPLRGGAEQDGREELSRWLDGAERVVETELACQVSSSCADGFCSGGRCHRYVDPELRAAGNTPLGKTLFYAGEYFRTTVLLDGRPCSSDGECASAAGYRCGSDGACYDALATCRTNHIVVFSDGEETDHVAPDDFFNPLVQARRLRYGLGCASDDDCLGGASCAGGSCVPPGAAPEEALAALDEGDDPAGHLSALLSFVDPEGAQQLRTLGGQPVSVQVHVLDVWGNPQNALLAWLGGGEYVTGTLDEPRDILYEMDLLFRSKGASQACVP